MLVARTYLKLLRGSSLQPVVLVMETRTQPRLGLGHSQAVLNVWSGTHLHPATGLASISWSSSQRARHTRGDLECLFLRAVSLWLGWTSRGTMTQIMRDIVKVADTCSSAYAPHQRRSLDAPGLRLQFHTLQQHRLASYHPSQSLGACRTTGQEKLVAQPTKCMPGVLVFVYPEICGRDAWQSPD